MVGQSFELAVLPLMKAPSTAPVAALILAGVKSSASAPLHDIARPSRIAPVNRQAESTCGKRTISSLPMISSGSCDDGMLPEACVNRSGVAHEKRENFCRHFFAKRNASSRHVRGAELLGEEHLRAGAAR